MSTLVLTADESNLTEGVENFIVLKLLGLGFTKYAIVQ